MAFDVREPADQRGAVARLEFVEIGTVDDARDDFAHVVRLASGRTARHHTTHRARAPVDVVPRIGQGSCGRRSVLATIARTMPSACSSSTGEVVGDAGDAGVHVGAAEIFGTDDLAGRRLHQRRPSEKNGAGIFDDDRFVGHRRHVRAAGRARAHDRGDLGDALSRHRGLVVEDAPEVVAIGKDFVLQR